MQFPIENYTITQYFGVNPEDTLRFGYPAHNGIDLWTDDIPPIVSAVLAGTVEKVGWEAQGYGKYVVILHGWWRSYYAHFDSVGAAPGQQVCEGQPIGIMGETGNATGAHLHLGFRFSNEFNRAYKGFVDPLGYLGGMPLPAPPAGTSLPPLSVSMPRGGGGGAIPKSILVKAGKKKSMYRMKPYF